MQKNRTDCLIVGAGPVGLTLACRLHQYGLTCRIVDKIPEPVKRTKAAAVWSASAEVFAQMGLDEKLLNKGLKVYGASFFSDGSRVARLELDSIDSLYNYVLMIAQHETEQVLRDYLEAHSVPIEYGKPVSAIEQSEEFVEVSLESGESIQASWAVGCDGAHSFVRKSQGLSFDGKELESRWIVGDLDIEGLPLEDELLLIMHKDGPAGLFPLGKSLFRVVAETETDVEDAETVLRELVRARVKSEKLKVNRVFDAGYFSIHERQVNRYRVGRVFLAGDSAHVQSPIGGQGMNTGIQDADNLAWKLAMVTKGLAKDRLLDSYHEERHRVAEWLVEATSRGTEIITNRQPLVAVFRPQVARLVAALPMARHKLRNTLAELEINYRKSSLSKEPQHIGDGWSHKQGIRSGERAQDGELEYRGEARRLSEFLRDCRFHLLLFDAGQPSHLLKFSPLLEAVKRKHADFVQPLFLSTQADKLQAFDCLSLRDSQGELHKRYAMDQAGAYLLRPDGHVAYRCKPLDQVELLNYLDRWSAS